MDPLAGVRFDTCAVVGSAGLLLIRVHPQPPYDPRHREHLEGLKKRAAFFILVDEVDKPRCVSMSRPGNQNDDQPSALLKQGRNTGPPSFRPQPFQVADAG